MGLITLNTKNKFKDSKNLPNIIFNYNEGVNSIFRFRNLLLFREIKGEGSVYFGMFKRLWESMRKGFSNYNPTKIKESYTTYFGKIIVVN